MTEALTVARHYFELSNAGNLVEIRTLFTPSSTYCSVNSGFYLGVDQIMAMQTAFFNAHQAVSWQVHNSEEVKPGIVLFDFSFSGTSLQGEKIDRSGHEYVIVFNGKIQHIDVRNNTHDNRD